MPGMDEACGVRVEEFIFLEIEASLYIEVVESVSSVLVYFLLHYKKKYKKPPKQPRTSLPSCALYVGTRAVQFKTFKQGRYGKRAITCRESIDPNIDEVKARTPQVSDGNHLQCLPPVIPKCDLQHKIEM